ncbi:MAG: hypothetical protein HOE69_05540 [Euryarchaeota archaeon]|nr:hypothetical protein [Euryarchaeota archaeon]
MSRIKIATLLGAIFLILILLGNIPSPSIQESNEEVIETDSEIYKLPDTSSTSGRGNSDLIIDYISASWTTADAGDSKSVTVRLKNQGTASSGSFYWGIYLSTDTTITTNDIELDTWYKSSISSGSSSSQYKSVTIPATITGGYYYVGAIVDINSQVSETNENNNDDYDTGRVHVYELADLVPRTTSSSCSTPSTGTVGDYLDSSISIQYENDVSSSHGQSTGSFDWAMYLSSDSSITTSDTQVGSDQYSSSLSSGSYRTDSLSTSNRIPSSMNAGTYYWGYILDVNTDVDESSETNNVRTCGQVTIQDDLPDIVADDIDTSSSSAVMGDTITVNYRIDNDGTDYTGSFYWELYLSTDRTITTNDVYVDEFSRSSISPGSYASGYQYSVQIPTGISPGYYYLGMIADSRSSVTELDETNNVVADTYRIDIEEPADLIVYSLSGPNSGNTGQQASLSWRIDNDGDDSSGWFYWKAYLSTDRTITSSDTQFGSTQQASSINGGSYRTGTLTDYIPSGLSTGTYYWGIIVDTTDRVDEGDENNNAEDGNGISITLSEPDLQADSISVDSSTSTICTEGTVTVNVDVSNQGNVIAGSHYYQVLFSQTGQSGSWTSIGHANGGSGNSYQLQVSGTIPASMASGDYYARMFVDSNYQISESDEYNNIYTTTTKELTVQDCTPDLTPTALSGPTSVLPGQTVTLSYTFENSGMGEASNFPVDMFLSTNPTIDTSDTHLGAASITHIAASASTSDSLSVTIPSNIAAGCWYYGIIVDMNNVIVELNENDNSMSAPNQVCILQPNLRVVSVSNPGPSTLGQSVDVSIVIENAGGANAARHQLAIIAEIVSPTGQPDHVLEVVNISSLAAGSNLEITRTVQLPTSPAGTYRIFAVVDYASDIAESDDSDNEGYGTSFEVAAPTDDLLAKWITGPTSAEPGQTITLQWEMQNLGVESRSFDSEVWLSQDQNLDSSDKLVHTYSISNLDAGTSVQDSTTVQLTSDDEGTWWAILKIDSSNLHQEDDENNNMIISANSLLVSTDAPAPEEETGGCIDPTTDGNDTADAAGARASATLLGVDVESITIEGCLMNIDNEDWFSIMLHGGKKIGVSLDNDGTLFTIELLNGSVVIDNGTLNQETNRVNLQLTNNDSSNTSRIYHIRIFKDSATTGGSYTLKIVTVDADEVPDLEPPTKPTFTALEEWISENEVDVTWSAVDDTGGSELSHYEIRWAGGLWSDIEGTNATLNVTALTDGRYSLEIRALDGAGNPSDADAMWVKIDRSSPTISVSQISTQYADPPVLQVSLDMSDGEGSGIASVEWSWDNLTWQEYPANGAIIWSNWSDIDLYVKATDNVGLTTIDNMTIDPPANPNAPPQDDNSESTKNSGGATSSGVATIVLIAMILAGMAGLGIYLIFRVNAPGEDDEEIDEVEQDSESDTEPIEEAPVTSVPNHEGLPIGGEYDTSTGVTWYILPDGNRWWMEEDGSFLLYQSIEQNQVTLASNNEI